MCIGIKQYIYILYIYRQLVQLELIYYIIYTSIIYLMISHIGLQSGYAYLSCILLCVVQRFCCVASKNRSQPSIARKFFAGLWMLMAIGATKALGVLWSKHVETKQSPGSPRSFPEVRICPSYRVFTQSTSKYYSRFKREHDHKPVKFGGAPRWQV